MIRHLLQLLRLLGVSMLAGAAWVAHRPAALPPAASLAAAPAAAKADDLMDQMRQATIKRAAVIEISAADINRHLAATLSGKIPGMLSRWVAFQGARIDLKPDRARLFLVWNIHGCIRTASVDLAISRDENNFRVDLLRGTYGHLQLPRGLMRPLYPSLCRVVAALDPEIRALFQMTHITIAKDKLILDPRFPHA